MMVKWLYILLIFPFQISAQEFIPAIPDYQWDFPNDHHIHRGYKTEWWYVTGHATPADQSRRFGFQFTIFKVESQPTFLPVPGSPDVIYLLHAAVTDEKENRFVFTETIQREFPGIAGFDSVSSTIFVENNSIQINNSGFNLKVRNQTFSYEITLKSTLGPIFHGLNGFSQKSQDKSNASHYYSVVDLTGNMVLEIENEKFDLKAAAWMDHEFGSNALSEFQIGWDWMTLKLSDGYRLMLFQVRGNPNFYSGTLISPDGGTQPIPMNEIVYQPIKNWTSATSGAVYPVEWKINAGDYQLSITPWLQNQELLTRLTGVTYWEGAIDVSGFKQRMPVTGTGYLEMTGYSEKMGGKL